MFPETDGISNIISDTIKIVFQQRRVDRVLRLWKEMAHREPFPRRDQIEPAMLGVDWLNCLVIAVKSPVRLSTFVYVGENLSFTRCPDESLAGVLLSHLPQVLSERRCLMIEGITRLRDLDILYRGALTRFLTTASQSTMCWARQTTARYTKTNTRERPSFGRNGSKSELARICAFRLVTTATFHYCGFPRRAERF
jgi:hypothetical protein